MKHGGGEKSSRDGNPLLPQAGLRRRWLTDAGLAMNGGRRGKGSIRPIEVVIASACHGRRGRHGVGAGDAHPDSPAGKRSLVGKPNPPATADQSGTADPGSGPGRELARRGEFQGGTCRAGCCGPASRWLAGCFASIVGSATGPVLGSKAARHPHDQDGGKGGRPAIAAARCCRFPFQMAGWTGEGAAPAVRMPKYDLALRGRE